MSCLLEMENRFWVLDFEYKIYVRHRNKKNNKALFISLSWLSRFMVKIKKKSIRALFGLLFNTFYLSTFHMIIGPCSCCGLNSTRTTYLYLVCLYNSLYLRFWFRISHELIASNVLVSSRCPISCTYAPISLNQVCKIF